MDSRTLHEPAQPPGNGHLIAGWEDHDGWTHVADKVEPVTLDVPSSVSVSIDWSTGLVGSSRHLSQVEVATKNYVASYGMALSHALAQAGMPAERLDISAAASSAALQAGPPTIYVEVRGQVPGIDQAGFESIARQAEQASTIWNALLGAYWPGTPEVRLNVILVEGSDPEFGASFASGERESPRTDALEPVSTTHATTSARSGRAGTFGRTPSDDVHGRTALQKLGSDRLESTLTPWLRLRGAWARWIAGAFAVALVGGIIAAQGTRQESSVVVVNSADVESPSTGAAIAASDSADTDQRVEVPPTAAPETSVSQEPAPPVAVTSAATSVPTAVAGLGTQGNQPVTERHTPTAAPSPTSSVRATPDVPSGQALAPQSVAASSGTDSGAAGRLFKAEISLASPVAGWPDNPESTAWFTSEGYRLVARHPGQSVAIRAPIEHSFRDVSVSGTFRKLGGPLGGGYGLFVRDDGQAVGDGVDQGGRYYVFEASDRGEVGGWRRERDQWIDLLPWTRSEAVIPGNALNELALRAVGQHLTFLVNGVVAAEIQDATLQEGRVGIFISGDANEVVIDRFVVEQHN